MRREFKTFKDMRFTIGKTPTKALQVVPDKQPVLNEVECPSKGIKPNYCIKTKLLNTL